MYAIRSYYVFAREKKALTEGTEMVICTPGRMIAHLNSSYVDFTGVKYLVLDEAEPSPEKSAP